MEIKRVKSKDVVKDRSGLVGSPKKGGGGGKGTWGKGGVDDLITVKSDNKDPNYDSEEEEDEDRVISHVEGISPIEAILKEYFSEGDIEEAIRRLKEVKVSHIDFVRKAMFSAMERQPYERELISKLLSALYGSTISGQNIAEGFQSALDKLEDTTLDIPTAGDMLGKFIARAIMDEIIPPAFLKTSYAESAVGKEALALAHGLITDTHRSRKLEHIWGPGDLESVKRLKQEAAKLLEEYLTTGDREEADRCVRRLNVPSFHFQLVRIALRLALSAKTVEQRVKLLELLLFFSREGLVVPDHMEQGFKACQQALDDLKLDIPNAPVTFQTIVATAKQEGWLSKDYQ